MPPLDRNQKIGELEDHQGAEEQELEDERQRRDERPWCRLEREHQVEVVDLAEHDGKDGNPEQPLGRPSRNRVQSLNRRLPNRSAPPKTRSCQKWLYQAASREQEVQLPETSRPKRTRTHAAERTCSRTASTNGRSGLSAIDDQTRRTR